MEAKVHWSMVGRRVIHQWALKPSQHTNPSSSFKPRSLVYKHEGSIKYLIMYSYLYCFVNNQQSPLIHVNEPCVVHFQIINFQLLLLIAVIVLWSNIMTCTISAFLWFNFVAYWMFSFCKSAIRRKLSEESIYAAYLEYNLSFK